MYVYAYIYIFIYILEEEMTRHDINDFRIPNL